LPQFVRKALELFGAERLWVNPDCGLKTLGKEEAVAALSRWSRRHVACRQSTTPASSANAVRKPFLQSGGRSRKETATEVPGADFERAPPWQKALTG